MFDASGEPLKMIGSNYDITDQVQFAKVLMEAKEKAEESERKLKQAFEYAGIGMALVSMQGQFLKLNSAACNLWGYTEAELLEKTFKDLTHPDDIKIDLGLFKRAIEEGKEYYKITKRYMHKSGSVVWANLHVSILRDANKVPLFCVAQIEDITKQVIYERELIIAKETAEESDRLKSRFLANMSHEIRTPMNGILGFTSILKSKTFSAQKENEFLDLIKLSGERMLNTINDIMTISEIEAGEMPINFSPMNVAKEIESIRANFLDEAVAKGIQIVVNIKLTPKIEIIGTDSEKVNCVLTNLVKNAIKFTHFGSVEIGNTQKPDKNEMEFYVKDTGIGISADQMAIIFNRFRQADESTTRSYEGTGLGLAISKAYIEKLGGKIWVESELGKGSTFYFTIRYK
jgi:PAS domain S-box-containing protein